MVRAAVSAAIVLVILARELGLSLEVERSKR